MRHAAGGSEGEGTGAREVGSRASERLELCVDDAVADRVPMQVPIW